MLHDWIPSTLGHSETMCRRCFVTNREAAALGIQYACDVPGPEPKPANDNVDVDPTVWTQEAIDAEIDLNNEYDVDDDESDGEEDCGRWDNGRLMTQCRKAGSEECDWDCPIGLPHRALRR